MKRRRRRRIFFRVLDLMHLRRFIDDSVIFQLPRALLRISSIILTRNLINILHAMRLIRAVIREKSRLNAHLIQMCHFVKESVRADLEKAEGLTELTSKIVATFRIAFERFEIKSLFDAIVDEELEAKTNHECEDVDVELDVDERERVLAVVGFFADDDELELKDVAVIAAEIELDATVHETDRCFVVGLEVILETSRTLVQSRERFCV